MSDDRDPEMELALAALAAPEVVSRDSLGESEGCGGGASVRVSLPLALMLPSAAVVSISISVSAMVGVTKAATLVWCERLSVELITIMEHSGK